jgi:hypothetical protein
MPDQRSGHLDVLVLEHEARRGQLVDWNQRRQRNPPFVGDARVDVGGIHLEEQARHLLERRRPPGVDARAQPRGPREPHQIAVVGRVIRVLVGQEDVAQGGQRNAGERELPGDAVAAVDHVGGAVDQDDLRGG